LSRRKKREATLGDAALEGARLAADGIGWLGRKVKDASQRGERRRIQTAYERGQRAHEEYLRRAAYAPTEPSQAIQSVQPSYGYVPESGHADDFDRLIAAINEFQPARRYPKEITYQAELYAWLKAKVGGVEFEARQGHTRPDIVALNRFAIEVKGPTTHQSLITIADKLLRYQLHYERVICVLFHLEWDEKGYEEWLQAVRRKYPEVVVIRK